MSSASSPMDDASSGSESCASAIARSTRAMARPTAGSGGRRPSPAAARTGHRHRRASCHRPRACLGCRPTWLRPARPRSERSNPVKPLPRPTTLGIVGAGRVGRAVTAAVVTAGVASTVLVNSRRPVESTALAIDAADLAATQHIPIRIEAVEHPRELLDAALLIVCVRARFTNTAQDRRGGLLPNASLVADLAHQLECFPGRWYGDQSGRRDEPDLRQAQQCRGARRRIQPRLRVLPHADRGASRGAHYRSGRVGAR